MLAVLKYPAPYSCFDWNDFKEKPPKCYYDLEKVVVAWALAPFEREECQKLAECDVKSRSKFRTLDASIMEYADDIAYAVHDIEDIVARELVSRQELADHAPDLFVNKGAVGTGENRVTLDEFIGGLFDEQSVHRKRLIGRLVNLLVVEARMEKMDGFSHPLLCYRLELPHEYQSFLDSLKALIYKLVIQRAAVKQLERRGCRVVEALYDELASDPEKLIPHSAWSSLDAQDTEARRVCDYIAGMTDGLAEKIYHRLFTPGVGSSRDELQ
jgi:dGTPase